MPVALIIAGYAFFSLWGETYLFQLIPYFSAELFFLSTLVMILRWKGPEGYFIAAGFGLLADCFSSLPFGANGLVFFALVWPLRWYALKIFVGARVTLPIITLIFVMTKNLMLLGLSAMIDPTGGIGPGWILNLFLSNALPTVILSVPAFVTLLALENLFNLQLAQRKF